MLYYRCPHCWGTYTGPTLVYGCSGDGKPHDARRVGGRFADISCNSLLTQERYHLGDRPALELYEQNFHLDLRDCLAEPRGVLYRRFMKPGANNLTQAFRFRPAWPSRLKALLGRPSPKRECPRCQREALAQCPNCWQTLLDFSHDQDVWPIAVIGFSRTGKTCTLCSLYHLAMRNGWVDFTPVPSPLKTMHQAMFNEPFELPIATTIGAGLDIATPAAEPGTSGAHIWLKDYPGEDLMLLNQGSPVPDEVAMTNMLATARGYLFMVDASAGADRLDRVARYLISRQSEMPAGVRAAVCITKADKHSDLGDYLNRTPANTIAEMHERSRDAEALKQEQEVLKKVLSEAALGGIWTAVEEAFPGNARLFAMSALGPGAVDRLIEHPHMAAASQTGSATQSGWWGAAPIDQRIQGPRLGTKPDPKGVIEPILWLVSHSKPD